MTVSNTQNVNEYQGNGIQTTFPYTYRILEDSDMQVYLDLVLQTTGYTVTGANNQSGGDVIFDVAPEGGVQIILERLVPITQLIDYEEYDPFPANASETGLDKGTMIDQQLQEQLGRTIKVPLGDEDPPIFNIGDDAANKMLNVDSTGKQIVAITTFAEFQQSKEEAIAAAQASQVSATLSQGYSQDSLASSVLAQAWAENPEDVPVLPGQFSAYNWAQKAKEYAEPIIETVRWRNAWVDIQYQQSDMVTENGWLMIANKDTTDHAAPQAVGSPVWRYPDTPAFVDQTVAGYLYAGFRLLGITNNYLISSIRVWLADVSADVTYSVMTVDNTTGNINVLQTFQGNVLALSGWYNVVTSPLWALPGQDVDLVLFAQNSTSDTSFNHQWNYTSDVDSDAPPASGECNISPTFDVFRINNLDDVGTDRSGDLSTVIPGSVIDIVDSTDSNKSSTYFVTDVTDNVTWYSMQVSLMANGNSGAPTNALATLTFTVPVSATTTYPTLAGFETGNVIQGVLKLNDGVPSVDDTGYGVDIKYQEYILSPDWDIASNMVNAEGGDSGGGGGGGVSMIVQDNKPDVNDYLEGQVWLRSTDMTKFNLYVDPDSRQWVADQADSDEVDLPTQLPEQMPPATNPALWNNRNILINGDFRINQRNFNGNWAGPSAGDYGYDRWRKGTAANTIEQPVEDGNYRPNTQYTLSINGVIDSQPTSPASGDWLIVVPDNATFIQLEEGLVMTLFEWRDTQQVMAMCQRYYYRYYDINIGTLYGAAGSNRSWMSSAFPVEMRVVVSGGIVTQPSYSNCTNMQTSGYSTTAFGLIVDITTTGTYNARSGVYDWDAEIH